MKIITSWLDFEEANIGSNGALYIETTGDDPYGIKSARDYIAGIACYDGTEGYYMPFRHLSGRNMPLAAQNDVLRCFSDDSTEVEERKLYYVWDLKRFRHFLDGMIANDFRALDGMLAMHLISEDEKNYNFGEIAERYGVMTDRTKEKEKAILSAHKRCGIIAPSENIFDYGYVLDVKDAADFATHAAETIFKLSKFLMPALREQNLFGLWQDLHEYSNVLYAMENRGVHVDKNLLKEYAEAGENRYNALSLAVNQTVGYDVNIASPAQVANMLGTLTSDKDILEDIIKTSPGEDRKLAMWVLEARAVKKAVSTYYKPYIAAADKNDDIRCTFNMTGTHTGRLSCSNPNFQAIAKESEYNRVKDAIVARKGRTFIQADYRQAELRLAAHYAKDDALISAFENGVDVHGEVARELQISRELAKQLNFAVLYGVGYKTFSKIAHISRDEAKVYIDAFHTKHPNFRKLQGSYEGMAIRNGYIELWTGRRRHFSELSKDTHKAMNNLIQGGAAEMMRIALMRLGNTLKAYKADILMQVHDSVLIEVDDVYVGSVLSVIRNDMCNFGFTPKPDIEISTGKRLSELEVCS